METKITVGGKHALILIAGDIYQYNFSTNSIEQDNYFNIQNKSVKLIACGAEHDVVVTNDNKIFTRGNGSKGQLGNNSTFFCMQWREVSQIKQNNQVMNLTNLKKNITHLAAGDAHTVIGIQFKQGYFKNSTIQVYSCGDNSNFQQRKSLGQSENLFSKVEFSNMDNKNLTDLSATANYTTAVFAKKTGQIWGKYNILERPSKLRYQDDKNKDIVCSLATNNKYHMLNNDQVATKGARQIAAFDQGCILINYLGLCTTDNDFKNIKCIDQQSDFIAVAGQGKVVLALSSLGQLKKFTLGSADTLQLTGIIRVPFIEEYTPKFCHTPAKLMTRNTESNQSIN